VFECVCTFNLWPKQFGQITKCTTNSKAWDTLEVWRLIMFTVSTVLGSSSCRKQAIVAISHILHVLKKGGKTLNNTTKNKPGTRSFNIFHQITIITHFFHTQSLQYTTRKRIKASTKRPNFPSKTQPVHVSSPEQTPPRSVSDNNRSSSRQNTIIAKGTSQGATKKIFIYSIMIIIITIIVIIIIINNNNNNKIEKVR